MGAPRRQTRTTSTLPSGPEPSPQSAIRLVFRHSILRKTIPIALVVGTVLSLVNQLHVVVRGDAGEATWLRIAANFVIPFIVSSLGVIAATRAEAR